MAGRCDLIYAAPGPALRSRVAAAEQAFAFEPLQSGINLTELGGPEIMDALVENGLQVVATGRLAEQPEQDVFQAHASTI